MHEVAGVARVQILNPGGEVGIGHLDEPVFAYYPQVSTVRRSQSKRFSARQRGAKLPQPSYVPQILPFTPQEATQNLADAGLTASIEVIESYIQVVPSSDLLGERFCFSPKAWEALARKRSSPCRAKERLRERPANRIALKHSVMFSGTLRVGSACSSSRCE